MKSKSRIVIILMLMLIVLTQGVSGDVVVQKDAMGPGILGAIGIGGLLLMAAAIVLIWVICANIIKTVRKKNVGK